jgi:metacaspase-1
VRVRCVLVGIDVYEHPDIPPLAGCVNDVALVRSTIKAFGVPNEDIHVLVNRRATKANIVDRIQRTVRAAEPGDVLVFYYSGHGSQVRDRNGDELADSLDEVICPYDMDWDSNTFILDDDLDEILSWAPRDVVIEMFVDCCFWGATPMEREVRFVPPPFDIEARIEGDEHMLHYHGLAACDCFAGRNVFWAASREGQIAAEDYLAGRTHGVFTYWGCEFMAANTERILNHEYSRQELIEDLHAYLHRLGYEQRPELWAPWDLQIAPPFLPGNPELAGAGAAPIGAQLPRPGPPGV